MHRILTIPFLLAPLLASAAGPYEPPDCDGIQSEGAICTGRAVTAEFTQADKELNATYRTVLGQLRQAGQLLSITLLTRAQRAWVNFRDTDCEAHTQYFGGVQMWQSVHIIECKVAMTRDRVKDLKATYAGLGMNAR